MDDFQIPDIQCTFRFHGSVCIHTQTEPEGLGAIVGIRPPRTGRVCCAAAATPPGGYLPHWTQHQTSVRRFREPVLLLMRHRRRKLPGSGHQAERRAPGRLPRFVVDAVADDESIASSEAEDENAVLGESVALDGLESKKLCSLSGLRGSSTADLDPSLEQAADAESASSSEAEVSEQSRRLHLAKAYLERIGAARFTEDDLHQRADEDSLEARDATALGDASDDDTDSASDAWNEVLYREAQQLRGQYYASEMAFDDVESMLPAEPTLTAFGHKRPPTCITFLPDGEVLGPPRYAITGGKDGALLLWDIERGAKSIVSASATSSAGSAAKPEILCVAASRDGRLVASGSRDASIRIYDLRQRNISDDSPSIPILSLVHVARGHRGAISGLAFFRDVFRKHAGPGVSIGVDRNSTEESLFSASFDRTLRFWSIERSKAAPQSILDSGPDAEAGLYDGRNMSPWSVHYVDSYYGHEEEATSLCCAAWGRLLSGGRDRTVRSWKVYDDTQLVYRAPRTAGAQIGTSIDCVAWVSPTTFVSGADDGSLSLWSTAKKKPVHKILDAHKNPVCPWICSVVSPEAANLVCSGSADGCVRLWRVRMQASVKASAKSAKRHGSLPESLEALGTLPFAASGFCNGIDCVLQKRTLYITAAVGQEHRFGKWYVDRSLRNGLAFWRIPLA